MSSDRDAHRVLAGDSRADVFEVVRAADRPMSVAEVAEAVGLHVNTVRGHLDLLADTGFLNRTTEHRNSPGRPRILYAATARPVPDEQSAVAAANYRILARVLVQQIAARAGSAREAHEIARVAGRTWAAATQDLAEEHPVTTLAEAYEALVTLMQDLGFDPRPDPARSRIALHACPYLDGSPARDLPVVCGVHQGLLEGTLERLGAPIAAVGLDVRLSPTRCQVSLLAREGSTSPTERGSGDSAGQ
ncbi:MAG: helix-turn-helix domain-containing protein [Candidatus Nanopelagicales bacterium]